MALLAKLTNDEYGKLEATVKTLYVQRGEEWWLDVKEVGGVMLDDVRGLKSALQTVKAEKAEVVKKLETYGDLDPSAARDALGKVQEMKDWSPDQKVKEQLAAVRSELSTKHAKELAAEKARAETADAALRKHLLETAAVRAISDAKPVDGGVELLLPHVLGQLSLEKDEASGKMEPRVVDTRTGRARLTSRQGSQDPMTVNELVEELKSRSPYSAAFRGVGAAGGGATGSVRGSGGGTDDLSNLPPVERLRRARALEAAAGAAQR